MTANSSSPDSLQAVLGPNGGRKKRLWWVIAAVIAAVGLMLWQPWSGSAAAKVSYDTEPVTRGDLTVTVSATGNLQPINQVDVGSEMSGTVDNVLVDDNARIRKGQVLATLDTAKLRDQITRSRAALASAEARVLQAEATQTEARANLARLQEVSRLSGGKVPAKAELAAADAAAKRADADLASARASVTEAKAQVSSDETNLGKATIRSPIDGVVLARKIEPGQTVAASLQAPVLFSLAEDLAQMELQVDVDEADIGQVREGQHARFTVDAWANRQFPAQIVRVGLGSQTKDGVVSYKTILHVTNDDLSLRPGMTATAEIITNERKGVLLIPNAALRFTPDFRAQKEASASLVSRLMPKPPSTGGRKPRTPGKNGIPKVWVLGADGKPSAVEVKTGATNGQLTEITGGELKEGMTVIVDSVSAKQ
ncbi:HlyD family secretion protein [Fluviicoccus keumensis]|uniref:HlyD family secretion protein n=1 Tax=Fluviicoccus keumensis TaxID=1435465 RepID=A0A4Q7ZD08_9GAMM|nr:efflux RND transporter periplasmic adaptor subunit [Fluviicoccus keumensis]RZU47885.1 HlyD family secretion protein [Fluviicoccus keumensis]